MKSLKINFILKFIPTEMIVGAGKKVAKSHIAHKNSTTKELT
jgi:hypothetical protein